MLTDSSSKPQPLSQEPIDFAGKALFLDFDGTLVDIAPTPDSIVIPAGLPQRLALLQRATDGAVAIVTGRDVSDIAAWLPNFTGPIAGGHGSHFRMQDGSRIDSDFDTGALAAIKIAIGDFAAAKERLLAEHKSAGTVLHYRQNPEASEQVHAFVTELLQSHSGFVAEHAKMAVEIKPEGVSKAAALERLMAGVPFSGRVPVFAGDDVSDEPAFGWVNDRGGLSIHVGTAPTSATRSVGSISELADWIDSALETFVPQQPRGDSS